MTRRVASALILLAASAGCSSTNPSTGPGNGVSTVTGAGGAASGASTGSGTAGDATGSGTATGSTTDSTSTSSTSATSASATSVGSGAGGAAGIGGAATTGGTGGAATGTGGMPGTGGGPPAMPVKGPDITITEFAIPTPSDPGAIAAGPDGKIWFTHQSTSPSAIGNLATDGTNFGLFKTTVTNIGPIAITGGPDGNVWYTKQGGVGKSTPAGMITEYGVPMGGDSGGIVKGPDGNLWFTEPVYDKIGRVTPAGAFMIYPLPGTQRGPREITLGPDGNLWFTEGSTAGNKIGRITPAGVVTEFSIPTPSSDPRAITGGPDGNVWFVEHDAHAIGRITPAGMITEFGIPSAGRPFSIAAGPDGNLWFTEPGVTNAIGRVTPMGGVSEYPIPSPNADAAGITVGPDGNMWFTEKSVNKIGRISDLKGGGNLPSAMGSLGTTLSGNMMCMKDTDCPGSGKACGGDVCSWKVAAHVCVLASSSDPGYCAATADCWCTGEGATCDPAAHRCSFTIHGGQAP